MRPPIGPISSRTPNIERRTPNVELISLKPAAGKDNG